MVDIVICVNTLFISLNMFQSSSIVRDWSSQDPMRTRTINTDQPRKWALWSLTYPMEERGSHCWMCESEGANTTLLPLLGIVCSRSIYDHMVLHFSIYIDSLMFTDMKPVDHVRFLELPLVVGVQIIRVAWVVQTLGLTGQGLDELEEYGILPQETESK